MVEVSPLEEGEEHIDYKCSICKEQWSEALFDPFPDEVGETDQ
jgi:hypothetical protein